MAPNVAFAEFADDIHGEGAASPRGVYPLTAGSVYPFVDGAFRASGARSPSSAPACDEDGLRSRSISMSSADSSDSSSGEGGGRDQRGPLVVGVMGGAFNPIHLGHVLLAVTVRETKPVDEVVLVPVYRHPVKTDLLPFEDRVEMCRLAVQGKGILVSTVEQEIEESNAAMLRAVKARYPPGTQLLWVCGDDVFDWIENEKGQAMMKELDGLIVQRRLHQVGSGACDRFYKNPMDNSFVSALRQKYGLRIDIIFAELPHFSSTIVRSSPASWKAYLPLSVASYLDSRPHLLEQLIKSQENKSMGSEALLVEDIADGPQLPLQRILSQEPFVSEAEVQERVTSSVMCCLAVVHALQRERGRTAMALSQGTAAALTALRQTREATDELLRDLPRLQGCTGPACAMEELAYTPIWLARDRKELDRQLLAEASRAVRPHPSARHCKARPENEDGAAAWIRRAALVKKYSSRIDVLIDACTEVLSARAASATAADPRSPRTSSCLGWWSAKGLFADEAVESNPEWMLRLFCLWAQGKEALGHERSFVSAGGSQAATLVRNSFRMRSCLNEVIENKDRMLRRVFSAELASPVPRREAVDAVNEVLQTMLTRVTAMEWSLMGCFAASTPLRVAHQTMISGHSDVSRLGGTFDVEAWFEASSQALDLMLTVVQGLAASICAEAAEAAALPPQAKSPSARPRSVSSRRGGRTATLPIAAVGGGSVLEHPQAATLQDRARGHLSPCDGHVSSVATPQRRAQRASEQGERAAGTKAATTAAAEGAFNREVNFGIMV